MRLIIATHNQHKLKEIKEALKETNLDIVGLNDLSFDFDIQEDKDTFIDNARIKAITIQDFYPDDLILADDSGFCVAALNNQPGVYSARYLGEKTSSFDKNEHIIKQLKQENNRNAMFVCAMVLRYQREEFVTQQVVYGQVSTHQRGAYTFGYDPIFIPNGYTQTFGENPELKKTVSHRSKAIKEVLNYVHYRFQ